MDSKRFVNNGQSNQEFSSNKYITTHAPIIMQEEVYSDMFENKSSIGQGVLSISNSEGGLVPVYKQKQEIRRLTSPTMQLTGHQGEVYCVQFSPCGSYVASAGLDKMILLWDVYNECKNFGVLQEHGNAILELHWSTDGSQLFSSSADQTVVAWDCESLKMHRKLKAHGNFVNSCHPARRGLQLVVSGDDDGCVQVWDLRNKTPSHSYENQSPVTAVSFNDTADVIFIGGLDNQIRAVDLRKMEAQYFILQGHTDTITGVALSHQGSFLLSNAMDNTIRCFDIRPYVLQSRCIQTFQGGKHSHQKNLLRVAWSSDGELITAGSADRNLYTWDSTSRKIAHRLGGHHGSINESVFNPQGDLIASASSDQTVIVGELPAINF